MALRFMESFDHLATANLEQGKWTAIAGGTVGAGGRYTNCWNPTGTRNNSLSKTFPDAQQTWIIGFAINFTTFISTRRIVQWLDAAGGLQAELRINASNQIYAARSTTTLATGPTVLSTGTWYYVEWKLTVDNTVGLSEVKLNGGSELTFSGDTQSTTNANASVLTFLSDYSAGPDNGNIYKLDDIYVCDGTGAAPSNTYLGDCRVEALFPSGNGNSSQLVGNDGNSVDNYLLVDESAPNGDTDYVESATVGNKDTYAYGDLASTSGTVFGVQPVPYFRKTASGSRVAVSVARLSGTEVDSSDKIVLDSYTYSPDIRETKPGGGAWTIADVNNAEFGMKVKS